MKKLNAHFNALSAARQKQLVVVTSILLALLLLGTINYNKINIQPTHAPQYIGRPTLKTNKP